MSHDVGSTASVQQSDNQAGGDIVGGNKSTVNNVTYVGAPTPLGILAKLLNRYKEEIKNDSRTTAKLEDLQRYGEPKENPLIPLDVKLSEGGREDLTQFALETKEVFAKQLAKHTHFDSAQRIHLYVLARIYSIFQTRILPIIRSGETRFRVEQLIQTEIIDPTLADLHDYPFYYCDTQVHGMIYYLTGNCHLRWV